MIDSFAGSFDGGFPRGGFIQVRDGRLTGTTYRNGAV